MRLHILNAFSRRQAAAKGVQIMVFAEGGLGIASQTYTRGGKTYNDGGGVAAGTLAEPIPEPLHAAAGSIVPCDWAGSVARVSGPFIRSLCPFRRSRCRWFGACSASTRQPRTRCPCRPSSSHVRRPGLYTD